jgi:hypothetical protein
LTVAAKITETEISSDLTRHTAQAAEGDGAPGRTVVPAARQPYLRAVPAGGSSTTSAATRSHLSLQVGATEPGGGRTDSGQGEPVSGTRRVQAGSESVVFAYVDGLAGAERKVLLNHIAQAWPEVVEAGVELVAQWRAECAEHRRENGKRRRRDQRRRQRAAAGNSG